MFFNLLILVLLIQGVFLESLPEKHLEHIAKDVNIGSRMTIETSNYEDGFKLCTIQLPSHLESTGKEFKFYPERDEELPENIGRPILSYRCEIEISEISGKEVGNWTMRYYVYRSGEEYNTNPNLILVQSFSIRIVNRVESFPEELTITEGNNAFIRLKEPISNITSCIIIKPDDTSIMVWDVQDKVENKDTLIELWGDVKNGECGAVIRDVKNDTVTGTWKIEAQDKQGFRYKSKIKVTVETKKDLGDNAPKQFYLTLGNDKTIDLTPKSAIWCRAKFDGSQDWKYCQLAFKPVKKSDSRKWIVSWLGTQSDHTEEMVVEVIVREHRYIETSVQAYQGTNHQSYNLMCRIKSQGIQHCVFERPDGKILNLKPGTGTDRYSYYGKGFFTSSYEQIENECGITIQKLNKEDIGIWKCSLNDANVDKMIPADVSFLQVKQNLTTITTIPHTSNQTVETYVTGNITIWCSIRSSLDYCLIQHPNGLETFSPNASTPIEIFDLRAGLCGVQIYNLTNKDAGEWSCRMGTKNGTEFSTTYTVYIYDNQIVSLKDIKIKENDKATISCRTLNNETIAYCKFSRHDGLSLHSKDTAKKGYELFNDLSNGLCKLSISKVTSNDLGNWKCSVGLIDKNEEISTILRLHGVNQVLAGNDISVQIIIIIISGIVIIIIAIAAVFYKYRTFLSYKLTTKRYSKNSMVKPNDPVPFYLPADSPLPKNA